MDPISPLGHAWIAAIQARNFDQLAGLCHLAVHSRLMTPSCCLELDRVDALAAQIRAWFGECDPIECAHARVEPVGGRLAIFYRLHLQEAGKWSLVEQQVYASLEAATGPETARITRIELLCSGFQPVQAPGRAVHAHLEINAAGGEAVGSTCALLTPAIKAKLRELEPGQVLEVRVDDPSAQADIESWSRLTGHSILEMDAQADGVLQFLVQKKES